jgi:hypothetical protein
MPTSKIHISTKNLIDLENIDLEELLDLFKIEYPFDKSGITINSSNTIDIPETNLPELKELVRYKHFTEKFGHLFIENNSTISTTIENINHLLENYFNNNKVDYFKNIEIFEITENEISLKLNTKLGINITLVIELPIRIEKYLIVNFKVKNGIKTLLKLVNSILNFSLKKTIMNSDNSIRIDIRELLEIPEPILHIIDNWLQIKKGNIIYNNNLLILELAFKIDKKASEELQF